jgi:hypothetical protein
MMFQRNVLLPSSGLYGKLSIRHLSAAYVSPDYLKLNKRTFLCLYKRVAIRKVQENQVGLILNGTLQLRAYAANVNLLGDNTDTIKGNTETLIDASKEVGLEINVQKTMYMLLSHRQDAGQEITNSV